MNTKGKEMAEKDLNQQKKNAKIGKLETSRRGHPLESLEVKVVKDIDREIDCLWPSKCVEGPTRRHIIRS